MNTLRKAFLIGATVIGLSSAALTVQAQEGSHHQYAATKFDAAKMAEHMEKRQQKLHDALKITSEQETAWQTYISAVKSDLHAAHADRVAMKDLPAPQRMEKHIELAKRHTAIMENHLNALKTFYAVLTPEQQKIMDKAVTRHHRHQRGTRRHG